MKALASSANGSPTLAAPADADAPLEGRGHRTFEVQEESREQEIMTTWLSVAGMQAGDSGT